MSWGVWAAVALLGSVGALGRFAVYRLISSRTSMGLAGGTFVVNASGSLALGLVTGLALGGNALLLVGAATIGSYTTFSTWMLEAQRLGEEGQARTTVANVLLSVLVGIGAAALGRAVGAQL
jgi:fluoride exporter